jgi:hypothetical protein
LDSPPPPPFLSNNIFCFILGGKFSQVGGSFWGKNIKNNENSRNFLKMGRFFKTIKIMRLKI